MEGEKMALWEEDGQETGKCQWWERGRDRWKGRRRQIPGTPGARDESGCILHWERGCVGWYNATLTDVNEEADEYLLDWDDGEKKDRNKNAAHIALHLNSML